MSPWKVILATIVIFVCGLVTGVLLIKTTTEPVRAPIAAEPPALTVPVPASNAPVLALAQTNSSPNIVTKTNVVFAPFQAQRMALIRQMVNRLKLDPNQKERISQIIKDSQERNKQLWDEIAPQMHEELKRVTDEIRQELRPGQAKHFMEMLRETRRENKTSISAQSNSPPNPAPPPPQSTNDVSAPPA